MKKNHFHGLEQGQIIMIVALAMFALIALAAVIIDGGALLVNRRAAQNAADAGALAGAQVLCKQNTYNATAIDDAVKKYTTLNNQADEVQWEFTTENLDDIDGLKKGEIEVTVEVSHGSFFARIFGEDTLSASATAAAGCFSYGASTVLPIAFPCNTPVRTGTDDTIASTDCDYSMITWGKFEEIAMDVCGMSVNPIYGTVEPTESEGNCIRDKLNAEFLDISYILVNSAKYCANDPNIPEGTDPTNIIVCDLFDDDEAHYQLTGSERGWLNLSDGNAGTATLNDWIDGINNPPLKTHVWLSFIGGSRENPVFTHLDGRAFDIVWIPVFNWICDGNPDTHPELDCYNLAHTHAEVGVPLPPDEECNVIAGSPGNDFGHVVAYAPFFITCVRINENMNPNKLPDPFVHECKGFEQAFNVNIPEDGELKDSALLDASSSVEGYFIQPLYLENPEQINPSGADLGIYGAHLTR